jgi:hypothetical protein
MTQSDMLRKTLINDMMIPVTVSPLSNCTLMGSSAYCPGEFKFTLAEENTPTLCPSEMAQILDCVGWETKTTPRN